MEYGFAIAAAALAIIVAGVGLRLRRPREPTLPAFLVGSSSNPGSPEPSYERLLEFHFTDGSTRQKLRVWRDGKPVTMWVGALPPSVRARRDEERRSAGARSESQHT
jgi:hypothetical protein